MPQGACNAQQKLTECIAHAAGSGLRGVALAVGVSQHQRACEKTSLTRQVDKSLRNERENTLTRHKYVRVNFALKHNQNLNILPIDKLSISSALRF